MGATNTLTLTTARRDPHAARLGVSLLLIGVCLTGIVGLPFGLYLWGKGVRNRLAFGVGTFEVVLERSSRAMAVRERTLRAYLYRPTAANLSAWRATEEPLESALDDAARHAREHDLPWTREVGELQTLAGQWDEAASALAESGTSDEAAVGAARPGPIYDEFEATMTALLADVADEKESLASDLATVDDARLAMPLVLSILCVPILLYVLRLSQRVLGLLADARAEQARLAAILEHMQDPVVVADGSGRITLLNPAARELLGVSAGEPVSALASRLRGAPMGSGATAEPAELLRALASGRSIAAAEAVVDRDGEDVPVSIASAPIPRVGSAAGTVTVLRDLSDRVRYEEKRVEAERFRALGAMAERLAHDFGNYLEAASAATSMLTRPSAADPEKRSRWAGVIRATVDEGRNVLASLRTVSFVSQPEPRFNTVDLRGVVARAIEVARHARPDARRIEIVAKAPDDPVLVHASEQDLGRAVVNIVVNAIDAMPDGGLIQVDTRYEGERARIEVRDSGPGIAPADRERVFEMYYTTKGERGSGMGLPLTREVLRLHGGDVELSGGGDGAVFTLALPRAPAGKEERARPDGPSAQQEA